MNEINFVSSPFPRQPEEETERIVAFLRRHLHSDDKAVIGLSGGIDADVAARLTRRAIGPDRLKLFIVIHENLENRFVVHARNTAASLGVPLAEIDLSYLSIPILSAIAAADPLENFHPAGLLDPARIKGSLRTAVFSTYVEKGYIVVGTSNRTEYELGFFLPLGDGAWHLGPLAHLYKSQVFSLARYLGAAEEVIAQSPSGGFWQGETDLEDIAFWLVHGRPVQGDVHWSPEEMEVFAGISNILTFPLIDAVLFYLNKAMAAKEIADTVGISPEIVSRISNLVHSAGKIKKRPLRLSLDD